MPRKGEITDDMIQKLEAYLVKAPAAEPAK
jgi:hypothetical protein